MNENDPLYFVINYILNQATSAELNVIGEALRRRSGDSPGPGSSGPRGMAQRMARNIQQQLGATPDIRQVARRIVTGLIRQKEPGIKDHELEVLLNTWLPSMSERPAPPADAAAEAGGPPPPDLLITMVATFVADQKGTLAPAEAQELPADWKQRYWAAFPPEVKRALEQLQQGRLSEAAFWAKLVGLLPI